MALRIGVLVVAAVYDRGSQQHAIEEFGLVGACPRNYPMGHALQFENNPPNRQP
jgi:hypothetical protein